MTDIAINKDTHCQNCGKELAGEFCATCGQKDKETRRPFILLVQEMMFVVFELDGRAYKTLWFLYTKPGFLSNEYTSGRRSSYTPPLRLFLVICIGFFLLVSLSTTLSSFGNAVTSTPDQEQRDAEFNFNLTNDDGDILTVADLEEDEDISEVIDFISDLKLSFLSEEMNANLNTFLVAQIEENVQELIDDPEGFLTDSLEYVTILMLLTMPVLALAQQIMHFTRKRFYVEHFILTMHNQTFVVFSIFLIWVVSFVEEANIPFLSSAFGWISTAINIWIFVYLYLSLKNFFNQGHALNTVKFLTLSLIYSISVGIAISIFMLLFFIFS